MIACRRYRCVSCGAILTVVPRGVAPRRHYGHAAIAMALTLWAITRERDIGSQRRSGELRQRLLCLHENKKPYQRAKQTHCHEVEENQDAVR